MIFENQVCIFSEQFFNDFLKLLLAEVQMRRLAEHLITCNKTCDWLFTKNKLIFFSVNIQLYKMNSHRKRNALYGTKIQAKAHHTKNIDNLTSSSLQHGPTTWQYSHESDPPTHNQPIFSSNFQTHQGGEICQAILFQKIR